MSTEEVKAFLRERLQQRSDQLGFQHLDDNTSLTETGLVDSFGLLELMMEMQHRFSINIDLSDTDPAVFTTFGGLAETVAKLS